MNPEISARLLVLLPIALIGLLRPWLGHTRPGILFGVTVPVDFAGSPEGRRNLRSYRVSVIALVVLILAAAAAVLWFTATNTIATSLTPVVAVFAELLGNLFLWSRHAARIKPYAITVPIERHADLTPSPPGTPASSTSTRPTPPSSSPSASASAGPSTSPAPPPGSISVGSSPSSASSPWSAAGSNSRQATPSPLCRTPIAT